MKAKVIAPILILALALFGCSSTPVDTAPASDKPEPPKEVAAAIEPPAPEEPPAPTAEETAENILETMTLEERVGQIVFARCPEAGASEEIESLHPGGYILFGRDFENETPESVRASITSYQSSSKIPMLIGIDEEGGKVVRASKYPQFRETPFAGMIDVAAEGINGLKADTAEKAAFLKDLGINVNLAPVCDVAHSKTDYIYPRTFGTDTDKTSEYVSAIVEQMKTDKIGSVLKHFPGYGNNVDTHTGVAYDGRSLEDLEKNDFPPFISGIAAGADSILVSHNVVECIDKDLPASLSPQVHELLRERIGFEGVIMTDDLAMDGVKNFSEIDAAVLAVLAGNDMLITSSPAEDIAAVMDSIKTGEINEGRIDEAVKRILIWKINLGLIDTSE